MSLPFALPATAPRPALVLADEPAGNSYGLPRHGAAPNLTARCDRVIRLADGQPAPKMKAQE